MKVVTVVDRMKIEEQGLMQEVSEVGGSVLTVLI